MSFESYCCTRSCRPCVPVCSTVATGNYQTSEKCRVTSMGRGMSLSQYKCNCHNFNNVDWMPVIMYSVAFSQWCAFIRDNLMSVHHTMWLKNWTSVIFSNNFNKYYSVLIIFGIANLKRIFSLQVSNWWVFIKYGISLLYFHCSLLQQTMLKEMGLCKENHILFLKISMSWKVLELKDW